MSKGDSTAPRGRKVLAFDPGVTTGWAVVLATGQTVAYGELEWDKLTADTVRMMVTTYRVEDVVVEAVVLTGPLNRDKFHQICAFDRVVQGVYHSKADLFLITPEQRKKIAVPGDVTGSHARDAYRLGAAWLNRDAEQTEATIVEVEPDGLSKSKTHQRG